MTDSNFTIRMPDAVKEALEEEAKRDNRSKAQVVILALRQYLPKPIPQNTIEKEEK